MLSDGILVVSLLGIVEILFPTPKILNLDHVEWIVLKCNPRGGYKVDVGSSIRVGRPLTRNTYQKEIEKDIAYEKQQNLKKTQYHKR